MSDIQDAEVEFLEEEKKIEEVSNEPVAEAEKFCHFCKENLNGSFNIFNHAIEPSKHMILPKGEGSHFNCYVKQVVFHKGSEDMDVG